MKLGDRLDSVIDRVYRGDFQRSTKPVRAFTCRSCGREVRGPSGLVDPRHNECGWCMKRTCSRCHKTKAIEEFPKDATKRLGTKSRCRSCDNEKSQRYYAANREQQLAKANERNARKRGGPRICTKCECRPSTSNRHAYCDICFARLKGYYRDRLRPRTRPNGRNGRKQRSRPKSTTERGYGNRHQQLRKKLKPIVESGQARCARCGKQILPGQPWDLGHADSDRSRYSGPEHRSCNRATSAHRVQRRQAAKASSSSRSW